MSGYIGNIPTPQATQTRDVFTATASQTSFATSGYTPGFVDVWQNGVKLVNGDDFTATNGSDVVLTVGAASGDTVEVLSFSTFELNSQTFTGTVTATAFVGDGSGLTGIAAGGGATGGGSDEIFWENDQTVTTDYTITNGKNAGSFGPITINTGVTVTVGAGEVWTVV